MVSIGPDRNRGTEHGRRCANVLAGERKDEIKTLCLWRLRVRWNLSKQIDELGHEMFNKIRRAGYMEEDFVGIGFYEDVVKLDIFGKAKEFDKDVLIIHGEKDQTVPVVVSEKYLEYYGDRATLKIIKDADHTFNNSAWEKETINLTADYLEKELIKANE